MNATPYLQMTYEQLQKEIDKNNKKIRSTKETIKLLEKLQIAEKSKQENKNDHNNTTPNIQQP